MRGPRTLICCCVSAIVSIVFASCTPIDEPTRSQSNATQSRASDQERDPDDAGIAADSGG